MAIFLVESKGREVSEKRAHILGGGLVARYVATQENPRTRKRKRENENEVRLRNNGVARQGLFPTVLLHSLHPWRSDVLTCMDALMPRTHGCVGAARPSRAFPPSRQLLLRYSTFLLPCRSLGGQNLGFILLNHH